MSGVNSLTPKPKVTIIFLKIQSRTLIWPWGWTVSYFACIKNKFMWWSCSHQWCTSVLLRNWPQEMIWVLFPDIGGEAFFARTRCCCCCCCQAALLKEFIASVHKCFYPNSNNSSFWGGGFLFKLIMQLCNMDWQSFFHGPVAHTIALYCNPDHSLSLGGLHLVLISQVWTSHAEAAERLEKILPAWTGPGPGH